MEVRALTLDKFSERARKHVDPAAPPPLRMMAARGVAPLPPDELIPVLYQLSFDADDAIRDAAAHTLRATPEDIIAGAVPSIADAAVLDRLVDTHGKSARLLETLLRQNAMSDETYARIAKTCGESLTELIAQNEVRVLRHPGIIESLFMNAEARTSTIDRLLDLARRHKISFQGLPALQALVEDQRYDTSAELAKAAEKDARFKEAAKASLLEDAEREIAEKDATEAERTRRRMEEQEEAEEGKGSQNKQAAIANMSISEKMRLASLGSSGDRDLLVKDANRLVHMAAATSPKVQLRDIVAWSGNKNLPDTVISYIANHQRYRRIYQITLNLVGNPKTPFKEAVKLLPNLQTRDLAKLARSRNVGGQVRRQAQALKEQRERR